MARLYNKSQFTKLPLNTHIHTHTVMEHIYRTLHAKLNLP